jgi:NodT family efflux transporter outer membrane factor (OMF) lipoprotein
MIQAKTLTINRMTMGNKLLFIVVFTLLLAACKVTRPYQRPAALATKDLYRDTSDKTPADTTGSDTTKTAPFTSKTATDTATIASLPWRQLFSDTLLQTLIQQAIDSNLDLKVALARIKEAQANFRQSRLAFYPSLIANAGATYQRLPSGTAGSNQVYDAFLSSNWEVDLWGQLKSASRAQLASLLQSYAYKAAVQTQLVASIANDYYALLAYDQELKVTIATVRNRKEDVTVTQALKEADVLTGAAVVESQANVFSAAVTIPDLKEDIRETENAICLLLARPSGPIARDSLDDQKVATDLSTGMPLQLLSNRPDVREAEFQLRNSTELVNVARTYFYPALTITAQGGWSSSNISQLFNASALIGNIIGGLTQPIFDNGLNRQRLDVAKGVAEENLYNFQNALLTAGQEVSNALYDYKSAADKIVIRTKEIFFLQKSVDYTKELMKFNSTTGNTSTNYTDVLTAEQNLLAAQLSGIDDKLQQLQAVVTLYTSLGGGWR